MDIERLTARNKNGLAYLVNVKPDEQEVDSPHKNTLKCILDCFERLAQYEEEAIARQSATSEEVQRAIEQLKYAREQDREFDDGTFVDSLDLAITALQAYQPWIPVSERLPESGKEALMNVAYNNRNQSKYDKTTKGFYVERFSIKEETWSDYTGNEDYCEEDDTYYIRQGWYSVCNFVDDFSYIDVPSGFTVTHWKPLPEPPKGE